MGITTVTIRRHVDPKSLRDMMVMNAAYTYFLARRPGGERWMARCLTRGYTPGGCVDREDPGSSRFGSDADQLGRLLYQGVSALPTRSIAIASVRSAWDLRRAGRTRVFAGQPEGSLARAVRDRASALNLGPIQPAAPPNNPEAEEDRRAAQENGHHHADDLPQIGAKAIRRIILGSARIRPILVRRQAELGRSHPAHGARNGSAAVQFRRVFQFLEKHGYVEFHKIRSEYAICSTASPAPATSGDEGRNATLASKMRRPPRGDAPGLG